MVSKKNYLFCLLYEQPQQKAQKTTRFFKKNFRTKDTPPPDINRKERHGYNFSMTSGAKPVICAIKS